MCIVMISDRTEFGKQSTIARKCTQSFQTSVSGGGEVKGIPLIRMITWNKTRFLLQLFISKADTVKISGRVCSTEICYKPSTRDHDGVTPTVRPVIFYFYYGSLAVICSVPQHYPSKLPVLRPRE